ncbi:MAG: hypothetical protein IKB87_04985 [Clostridia bacterium]|nr:hypothetical protein [Clostridia bacterium]
MAEKKYIEREALLKIIRAGVVNVPGSIGAVLIGRGRKMERYYLPETVDEAIRMIPAADVVEVVRCNKCRRWRAISETNGFCDKILNFTNKDGFCSLGEKVIQPNNRERDDIKNSNSCCQTRKNRHGCDNCSAARSACRTESRVPNREMLRVERDVVTGAVLKIEVLE